MMLTCRMIRIMKLIISVSGVITTIRTVKGKEYCFLIHLCRRPAKLNASSTKYTVSINIIVILFKSGFFVVLACVSNMYRRYMQKLPLCTATQVEPNYTTSASG